jgi:hypothetical protein
LSQKVDVSEQFDILAKNLSLKFEQKTKIDEFKLQETQQRERELVQ